MSRSLPQKLLSLFRHPGIVVLGFLLCQSIHAAPRRPAPYNRCIDAGKILSAAIEGEAHRTDVLLKKAPDYPQVVTNSSPAKLVQLTDTSYVWATDWSGDQPSHDLVRRWLAARYVSISACFGPARSQRRIGHLPGFANYRPISNHKAPRVILATAPVSDKSGTYALVYYSTAMKAFPLGGRTVFALVRKSGSGWKKIGFRILAVS